jgi:hypothetical protein
MSLNKNQGGDILSLPYHPGETMKKREEPVVDKDFDPMKCEFKTMDDYDKFNAWVRKTGRHEGHKVRVPTEDFYKKVKIKFQRFDQVENLLKARCRNRDIDWTGQLKPGGTYYLAPPVITYLNNLSTPIYEEVKVTEDGVTRTETRQTGERSRFSCQVLEFAA